MAEAREVVRRLGQPPLSPQCHAHDRHPTRRPPRHRWRAPTRHRSPAALYARNRSSWSPARTAPRGLLRPTCPDCSMSDPQRGAALQPFPDRAGRDRRGRMDPRWAQRAPAPAGAGPRERSCGGEFPVSYTHLNNIAHVFISSTDPPRLDILSRSRSDAPENRERPGRSSCGSCPQPPSPAAPRQTSGSWERILLPLTQNTGAVSCRISPEHAGGTPAPQALILGCRVTLWQPYRPSWGGLRCSANPGSGLSSS